MMGPLSLAKALALLPLLVNLVQAASGTSGTCSKDKKCDTGCCSKEGYCGFGPKFCDDDVCISDCDAKAECGPYAAVANTTCPLNVCCSEFGFCGTSEDFCGKGCQSGCDAVKQPSCSGTSSKQIYGGYFEAFSYKHKCDVLEPKNIDVQPWTHLYYAFAGIESETSEIKLTYKNDDDWIPQMVDLKKKKPDMKIFLSIGGWDLGGRIFSDMVRFKGMRKAFINSAVDTMDKWGFDGVDIDWEYPGASDRDGRDEDTDNLVQLMKELKDSFGDKYGISATLPSSYYYLKGFDVKGMAKYTDHFNFMSYDIHGTWDGHSKWTSSVVNPHTNLTEISQGLDLLWRNDIDPAKVNLGLGFYGRSFTLNDTSCTKPGCAFDTSDNVNGGGTPGECTDSSGILSDYEINRIIQDYDPDVTYSKQAAVNWMTWSKNQWVSFDNAKTLKQKADFANSRCLGGTFAWTLDEGGPASTTNPNRLNASDTSMAGADTEGGSDGTGDFYLGDTVLDPKSNTATGIAPLNMIVAPSTLSSATTFSIEPLTTAIEVAWTTTETVTISGQPTTTPTVARTVQTTTFSIPPVTTTVIPWWNWNITGSGVTQTSTTLFPSISLDPITFRNSDNPQNITNGTFATHTVTNDRTFVPPPWPWSTTSLPVKVPTPTVTFSQGGPPGPTCTANCGTKCTSFCDTPCLDCNNQQSNNNWKDPEDPDPPSHSKCSGSNCKNNECTGPLCTKKGCKGADCSDGVCLGSRCEKTGCIGSDCNASGECDGENCHRKGCEGDDCNGQGLCIGPQCISIGCIGLQCNSETGECTGSDCTRVSCSGTNCEDGVCKGEGCKSEDEDDCESKEADVCTEMVYSSTVTPVSTMTTETSTSCQTITACSAEASTTTTTISDDPDALSTPFIYPLETENPTDAEFVASSLDSMFKSIYASTTTTSTNTAPPTTTTSQPSTTSHDWSQYEPTVSSTSCGGSTLCDSYVSNFMGVCDHAKSYIVATDLYMTIPNNNGAECYSEQASHWPDGCGVFLQGDKCQIAGESMKIAYDEIFKSCDKACGHATFSNGCVLKVDYIQDCYKNKSKGGVDMTNPDNWN